MKKMQGQPCALLQLIRLPPPQINKNVQYDPGHIIQTSLSQRDTAVLKGCCPALKIGFNFGELTFLLTITHPAAQVTAV